MHSTVAHNTNRILVESDDFKIYHCFYSCSIIYCYNHYNQPQAKDSCTTYYSIWVTLVVVVTPAHDAKHAFPYSWPSHPQTGSHSAIQKQSGLGSYFTSHVRAILLQGSTIELKEYEKEEMQLPQLTSWCKSNDDRISFHDFICQVCVLK
jgi:hypothetical protein